MHPRATVLFSVLFTVLFFAATAAMAADPSSAASAPATAVSGDLSAPTPVIFTVYRLPGPRQAPMTVPQALVLVSGSASPEILGKAYTSSNGQAAFSLPFGSYVASVTTIGRAGVESASYGFVACSSCITSHSILLQNLCGNSACDNGEQPASCPQDCSSADIPPGKALARVKAYDAATGSLVPGALASFYRAGRSSGPPEASVTLFVYDLNKQPVPAVAMSITDVSSKLAVTLNTGAKGEAVFTGPYGLYIAEVNDPVYGFGKYGFALSASSPPTGAIQLQPSPLALCGNKVCESGEATNCPQDCGSGTSTKPYESITLTVYDIKQNKVPGVVVSFSEAFPSGPAKIAPVLKTDAAGAIVFTETSGFYIATVTDPVYGSGTYGFSLCSTCPKTGAIQLQPGPTTVCGNAVCESGEMTACPQDCAGGGSCGDGICGIGENAATCPTDCAGGSPICGNNICETGEANVCPACVYASPSCKACTAGTCPQDCKDIAPPQLVEAARPAEAERDYGEYAGQIPADGLSAIELQPGLYTVVTEAAGYQTYVQYSAIGAAKVYELSAPLTAGSRQSPFFRKISIPVKEGDLIRLQESVERVIRFGSRQVRFEVRAADEGVRITEREQVGNAVAAEAVVKSGEVSIEGDRFLIKTAAAAAIEVKAAPSEAVQQAISRSGAAGDDVWQLSLDVSDSGPVYTVDFAEQRKIFGVFDTEVRSSYTVNNDAQVTGERTDLLAGLIRAISVPAKKPSRA